jgi:hypothetical protein
MVYTKVALGKSSHAVCPIFEGFASCLHPHLLFIPVTPRSYVNAPLTKLSSDWRSPARLFNTGSVFSYERPVRADGRAMRAKPGTKTPHWITQSSAWTYLPAFEFPSSADTKQPIKKMNELLSGDNLAPDAAPAQEPAAAAAAGSLGKFAFLLSDRTLSDTTLRLKRVHSKALDGEGLCGGANTEDAEDDDDELLDTASLHSTVLCANRCACA